MILLRALSALMLCFIAFPAAAQSIDQPPPGSQIVAAAASPSGSVKVNVTLNSEGRVGYMISRLGKPVITESRLGFLFTEGVIRSAASVECSCASGVFVVGSPTSAPRPAASGTAVSRRAGEGIAGGAARVVRSGGSAC